MEDFDALGPSEVREIPGGGLVGTLADGRAAVARPTSTGGSPTLEIQSGSDRLKIRFED